MQKRNVLDSPRLLELKKKKKQVFIRKIVIFGVLFVLLLVSLVFISRINRLNFYDINVSGNKIIDTTTVQKVVEEKLSGKYIWLFPKTNIFLYPKTGLKEELANAFKRFKSIEISSQNVNTLHIEVAERSPEYLWCGNTLPAIDERRTCYFLDTEGYIFDEAPYFSGEVYFKFYGETELSKDGGNPSGSHIAPQNFSNLISFKNTLAEIGLKPATLYIGNDDNLKMGLSRARTTGAAAEILFKKDSDLQKISENLKAALNAEPLQSKFKNEYSSLEYIDLRFGNKVYYKFR